MDKLEKKANEWEEGEGMGEIRGKFDKRHKNFVGVEKPP